MRMILRYCLLFAAIMCAAALAQAAKTWTALTATGTTALYNVPGNDIHTMQAIVTGSPASCTVHLEGSIDSTHWFDLSGDQTCTSSMMFHVVARSVLYVRGNLITLSGGTSPTVTLSYSGIRSGPN